MLKTEMRNPNTMHIDRMSPEEMVQVMQQENLRAAAAVGEVLPAIAAAIDRIGARMHLFYGLAHQCCHRLHPLRDRCFRCGGNAGFFGF